MLRSKNNILLTYNFSVMSMAQEKQFYKFESHYFVNYFVEGLGLGDIKVTNKICSQK